MAILNIFTLILKIILYRDFLRLNSYRHFLYYSISKVAGV